MNLLQTTCAALGAALLAGCAGVTTDVRALGLDAKPQGDLTYRFADPLDGDANPDRAPYEALVRDGLARYGFTQASGNGAAHYMVAVSYDTRAAAVGVKPAGCEAAPGGCGAPPPAGPAAWFGGPSYVHTLTLRLFAVPDGRQVYTVSTERRDKIASAAQAMPYLVQSALAQFPYAGANAWRVKLDENASGTPRVVSVKPLAP